MAPVFAIAFGQYSILLVWERAMHAVDATALSLEYKILGH